jgi:hypothetical protein
MDMIRDHKRENCGLCILSLQYVVIIPLTESVLCTFTRFLVGMDWDESILV